MVDNNVSNISGAQNDLEVFRSQNPALKVVASLGGDDFSADTFSSLIADKDRFDNLTSSVNDLYKDGVINGIEIDWEWPVKEGGKKDRVKLIRYARVSFKTFRHLKLFLVKLLASILLIFGFSKHHDAFFDKQM